MNSRAGRFRWVVVGGGAAGCWLARRLAAQSLGAVALVEAGDVPRDPRCVVPAWYPLAQNTRLDWGYRTEPQRELAGRKLAWPRGKCLGGSSALNALIYMLPSKADLDRWSRAVGGYWVDAFSNLRAEWDSVLEEHWPSGTVCCPITGMRLGPVQQTHAWCRSFLEAATMAGLDLQSPWLQSASDICGNYWLTAKAGRRQTVADPLIATASSTDPQSQAATEQATAPETRQPNVLIGCHAHRIIVEQGRAVAVEVSSAGSTERWRIVASDTIILAAGAIGSPELLLRSGLGPAKGLQAAGIRCQFDSPNVGENLQDHLAMPIVFQMKSAEGLPYRFGPQQRARYRQSGSGPLASNIAEVGAMLGDVQLHGARAAEPFSVPQVQLHVTPTHYLKYPVLPSTPDCMSIAITPLHPAARGQVRLGGRLAGGTREQPRLEIDPCYLSDATDLNAFLTAYRWILEALAGSALRSSIAGQLIPTERRSDAAGIGRAVRALAQSIYHPVGTCRAGADGAAVVDDRFRFRGVDGLCIADASVLPDLPSGNTCAAAILMAEVAARAILDQ